MYKEHLREMIQFVLMKYDLYSRNAEELLMLTAACESNLGHYFKQLGGGPALGIFQVEPATYDWMQTKTMIKFGGCYTDLNELCKKHGYEKGYIDYISSNNHMSSILKSKEYANWTKWLKIDQALLSIVKTDEEKLDFMLNIEAQIISARLIYWFKTPKAIPDYKDIELLARYWKRYWNSELGAGTIEGAIKKYNKYVK